ncbi:hypothetical protein K7A42_02930 [Agrobacterium sp. InxBP2]|uniref:hypothetical protein n=1 Tax=Agrobacterium sp. InxBP2 TaxID=2870329 RepID=UPI00249EA1F7|nr:hypothetical protein [Agrobacterium sp. InxBP2]MCW8279828.1 hypothetical protein [Agrobacterium sp. InxBP2]
MSEMIERVARAIFADYHRQGINHDDFDVLLPSIQDSLKSVASAAINAMREPTEAQLEAAEEIVVGFDDFACGDGNIYLGIPGYPQKARDVWAALVDAALKETA